LEGRADPGPGTALRRSRPCLIFLDFLTGRLLREGCPRTGKA
jgi:hypothetical protein